MQLQPTGIGGPHSEERPDFIVDASGGHGTLSNAMTLQPEFQSADRLRECGPDN